MNSLSGFRDYLPQDEIARQQLIDKARAVFELYGFSPLQTPAMESPETLAGKYGEESDKLIFEVMRRGNDLTEKFKEVAAKNLSDDKLKSELKNLSDMSLRFDLTVPLARVIAQYRNEIPLPFKRYQIAPVWRAESPQKGRYREFYQCDFDIVGSRDMAADAEIVQIINSLMEAFDLDNFTIKINNRKILDGIVAKSGIPQDKKFDVFRILDKIEKIGADKVKEELKELGVSDEQSRTLLEGNKLESLKEKLAGTVGAEGLAEIEQVLDLVSGTIKKEVVKFDPTVVRGLDYYTGNVFEVTLNDKPEAGAIMGGGRFDKLIGSFIGQDIPAVGCSIGFDRLFSTVYGETEKKSPADYFVAIMTPEVRKYAFESAKILRENFKKVYLYPKEASIGDQLSFAEKMGFEKVVIIGEDEAKNQSVTIKNLKTREQKTVPLSDLKNQ